jgi:defect-in-organelle-trafficking protein DotC
MLDDIGYNSILDEINKAEEEPEIVQYDDQKVKVSKKTYQNVKRLKLSSNKKRKEDPDSLMEIVTMSSEELVHANKSLYNEDGELKNNSEILDDLNGGFRAEQIYNEALIYGINSGLYSKTHHYKKMFEAEDFQREFDQIFIFRSLMLANGRVQPAIILESEDIFIKESNLLTREIKQSYKIIEQAKVVSAPKDWRNYIMSVLYVEKPRVPHEILLPRTKSEKTEWEKGVTIGWKKGEQMAYDNIKLKIRKLGKDFLGMVRYHLMLQQNIVSTPITYETPISVSSSSNGEALNIGETIFEINMLPTFNSNSETWKALPQIDNLIIGDGK